MEGDNGSLTSFGSRRFPTSVSFMGSEDNVDLMSNRDINEYITALEVANKLKTAENECLAEHVKRWRPEALNDLDYLTAVMCKAAAHFLHTPAAAPQVPEKVDISEDYDKEDLPAPSRTDSITSTTSLAYIENVSRVGNEEKLRMVRIAMLGVREQISELQDAYWKERRHLDGVIENLEFMLTEHREAQSLIKHNLSSCTGSESFKGQKSLPGALTAEIFQFHVIKLLRDMDHKLEKLRMVRSNMFPTIEELRHTYERRRELAKELHAVDWEKLRMLRSKLRGDFEQITRFWQETRHDVGYIGLDVHEIQRRVPRVRARKRRVDVVLASRLERIDFSLAELPHVQKQISEAMRVFTEKKVLKDTYRGPTVMAYIEENRKLSMLQKEILAYERKLPIRRVTLYNAFNMLHSFKKRIRLKFGKTPHIDRKCLLLSLDQKPTVERVLGTFANLPLLPKKSGPKEVQQNLSLVIDGALFPDSSKRTDIFCTMKERCRLLDKGLCINNAPLPSSSTSINSKVLFGIRSRMKIQTKPEPKSKSDEIFQFNVTKF